MTNQIIDKFKELFKTSRFASNEAFGEQIFYLLFARLLGRLDLQNRNANKEPVFIQDLVHLRWNHIVSVSPDEQLRLINGLPTRQEQESWQVCPWMNMFRFFRSGLNNTSLKEIASCFQEAECRITDSQILSQMIHFVDELPIEGEFRDNFALYSSVFMANERFGGVYYYPKCILKLITVLSDPSQGDTVCDPSCAYGNLLAQAFMYSCEKSGASTDSHKSASSNKFEVPLYYGYDVNRASTKLAVVNMLLHNCTAISIAQEDSIGRRSQIFSKFANTFDRVVLESPLRGMLQSDEVLEDLIPIVKTKRSEILFLALTEHLLKSGGRGVVCVPASTLCFSTDAYDVIRERLVEKNQLEAIIFLPHVFPSLSALLVFTKNKTTDKVLCYKIEEKTASSASELLDDLIDMFLTTWKLWNQQKEEKSSEALREFEDRKKNYFYITKENLISSGYDFSFEKYHKIDYIPEKIPSPDELLMKLQSQEDAINSILNQLKQVIK